jgi:DNA-binding CsgD family transcriptional regulator
LFAERAAAAEPGFVINESNWRKVAELCRRLDGIPLALELTSVRLDGSSVDQLIEELDHQLALAESHHRGGEHRHHTLRATIDWSYQLLSDQEKSLWTRLAIFSADFGVQAATTVCQGGELVKADVPSLLGSLVEKSMVIRQSVEGAARYRLLEPMRQFAAEQPQFRATESELRRRLVTWIAELAHSAHSPGPQSENFQRVQLESASVWKAIDMCQREHEYAEQGIAILYDLCLYFGNRGSLPDARRAVEHLLQNALPEGRAMAQGLFAAGVFAVDLRDMTAAKRHLTASIRIARLLGDPEMVGWCLFHLASVAWEEGDRVAELDQTRQMLELSRAMQNEFQYSAALWRLGLTEIERGDATRGLQMVEEALATSAHLNEEYYRSLQLWSLAVGRMRLGHLSQAETAGRAALKLAAGLGDGHSLAITSECLAWIAAERRDAVKAARLLGYAMETWKSMGGRLFPPLIGYHERCESYARTALGDERFTDELRRGEALSQAEVIDLASHNGAGKLNAPVRPWAPTPAQSQADLTGRESEIARMVAGGLTNKEIAAELVISGRTVEAHVGHILNKLGLNSRIQLASWVARREPAEPSPTSAGG